MSPRRRRLVIILPLLVLSMLLRWHMADQRQQDQRTANEMGAAILLEEGERSACHDNGGQWLATPNVDPRVEWLTATCVAGSPSALASPGVASPVALPVITTPSLRSSPTTTGHS